MSRVYRVRVFPVSRLLFEACVRRGPEILGLVTAAGKVTATKAAVQQARLRRQEGRVMTGSVLFVTVHVAGCRPAPREVSSLAQASAACCAAIDADGLGASDMGRKHGEVRDAAGTLVARVAYNGRVFAPNGALLRE